MRPTLYLRVCKASSMLYSRKLITNKWQLKERMHRSNKTKHSHKQAPDNSGMQTLATTEEALHILLHTKEAEEKKLMKQIQLIIITQYCRKKKVCCAINKSKRIVEQLLCNKRQAE
jgi:hypothetical protein